MSWKQFLLQCLRRHIICALLLCAAYFTNLNYPPRYKFPQIVVVGHVDVSTSCGSWQNFGQIYGLLIVLEYSDTHLLLVPQL